MIRFFESSRVLHDWVDVHDVKRLCGFVGLGTISYVDTAELHVTFDSRYDYDDWCAAGCPVQLTLF